MEHVTYHVRVGAKNQNRFLWTMFIVSAGLFVLSAIGAVWSVGNPSAALSGAVGMGFVLSVCAAILGPLLTFFFSPKATVGVTDETIRLTTSGSEESVPIVQTSLIDWLQFYGLGHRRSGPYGSATLPLKMPSGQQYRLLFKNYKDFFSFLREVMASRHAQMERNGLSTIEDQECSKIYKEVTTPRAGGIYVRTPSDPMQSAPHLYAAMASSLPEGSAFKKAWYVWKHRNK